MEDIDHKFADWLKENQGNVLVMIAGNGEYISIASSLSNLETINLLVQTVAEMKEQRKNVN